MMRTAVTLTLILTLAACGSSRQQSTPRSIAPASVPYSAGPIQSACLRADRRNASQRLCGCVQAVANRDLTRREQSRAVSFFDDPQKAQDARGGSAFWKKYRAFSNRAAQVCSQA